jgi:hypothetical protein
MGRGERDPGGGYLVTVGERGEEWDGAGRVAAGEELGGEG